MKALVLSTLLILTGLASTSQAYRCNFQISGKDDLGQDLYVKARGFPPRLIRASTNLKSKYAQSGSSRSACVNELDVETNIGLVCTTEFYSNTDFSGAMKRPENLTIKITTTKNNNSEKQESIQMVSCGG